MWSRVPAIFAARAGFRYVLPSTRWPIFRFFVMLAVAAATVNASWAARCSSSLIPGGGR